MDENRRKGFDRRIISGEFINERRINVDKRVLTHHKKVIVSSLKKTAFFSSFTNDETEYIINICAKKTFKKKEIIFYEGDAPDDMYILFEGILQVSLHGKDLNLISPIGIVGEMGVYSGEPRFATVSSKTDCVLYKLNRIELLNLLGIMKSLNDQFQRGMIINLSEKLRNANDLIIKLKNK